MTRKYLIRHETRYRYAADVVHSHHLLHLVPRPAPYQQCLEHEIGIEPAAQRRTAEFDAFGNPDAAHRDGAATPRAGRGVADADRGARAARGAGGDHRALGKSARLVLVSRGVAVARPARGGALSSRVSARAPQAGLHRLFGGMFPGRPAHPGLRRSADQQAAGRDHVCPRRDRHRHRRHRSSRDAPRRLPGLRAPDDRLPAFARPAGTLCQRLSTHQRARVRGEEAGRRWRLACLGFRVEPALWLDRVRSHQWLLRGHRPCGRGLGAGLRRRITAARRDPRRRQASVVGDGGRGAHR